MPSGTNEEAMAWTQRFSAADPKHAAVLERIRKWGRRYGIDWIGPWRIEDDVHAGDCMRACFHFTRWLFQGTPNRSVREGGHLAPRLLAEFAPLLAGYQRRSGDLFPNLDDCLVRETRNDGFLQGLLAMTESVKTLSK